MAGLVFKRLGSILGLLQQTGGHRFCFALRTTSGGYQCLLDQDAEKSSKYLDFSRGAEKRRGKSACKLLTTSENGSANRNLAPFKLSSNSMITALKFGILLVQLKWRPLVCVSVDIFGET